MKQHIPVSREFRDELLAPSERQVRLSVSVSPSLIDWVEAVAQEVGCSKSRVVAVAIRRMMETDR